MENPFLNPFVLTVDPHECERHGDIDLYLPRTPPPWPAVIFVPGGPLSADRPPRPRHWPVYQGRGSHTAGHGVAAAVVEHELYEPSDYPRAADKVAAAVDLVRSDHRVDPNRLALWFFCGGSPLLSDWLRKAPSWLRCVAASYPVLGSRPGKELEDRFEPARALRFARHVPIILTRVGLEQPEIAATVEDFVATAREEGARLEIIDVPGGRHGFDFMDHTEESRKAVEVGLIAVLNALDR